MPLFHGLSVEIKSQVASSRVPRLFLAMLFYFLLPVGALLVAVHAIADPAGWSASAPWRAAQFWFSVVYSLRADSKSQHVFGWGCCFAIASSSVMSCITACIPARID